MNIILAHLFTYRYLYIIGIILILIILLITLKPKRVKPIEVPTLDDKKEKSEIESLIETLETSESKRSMTSFEEEQEANAIISYQELVAAVNAKKASMKESESGKTTVMDVIENLNDTKNLNTNSDIVVEEVVEEKEEIEKKFKNSEFISPIFGKDGNKTNEDFLTNLKDFRSNL